MKTEIYLVRHGQTEWNVEKRFQGSGDSPLTELGIEQAKALSNHLKDIHFDAIYCSPAGRAQRTAQIIKGNRQLKIETISEFQEINLNSWEGQLYKEIEAKNPELYNAFWHSPDLFYPADAESFEDVTNRTYPTLLKLIKQHPEQRILIVSHAAALKSILTKIKGLPLRRFWENNLLQTSVSILEYKNERLFVLTHGETSHLKM